VTDAVSVFSTCPQSSDSEPAKYCARVTDVARWSEAAGCKGILVYSDNRLLDPWLVSQRIIEATERLCPLVAVQPIYMHPYAVAKMVTTFGLLYHRKTYLNMIAGGFKRDLEALNDLTPHDERYDRLEEYSTLIVRLLEHSARGVGYTLEGKYYSVKGLKISPPLPAALAPELFVSGTSEAGQKSATVLDATAIRYPEPPASYEARTFTEHRKNGVRVGIIARATADEAWQVAEERFPPDRKGEVTHQLAMKVSDSTWHKQLSERAIGSRESDDPYWLRPFQSYQTFCPYLVGSYDRVAREIARYITAGFRTFIVDIPPDEHELYSSREVFERAEASAR